MLGNSLVAAQLAASQEGLNSMELVSYTYKIVRTGEPRMLDTDAGRRRQVLY
jgi:hypothetical protein